jgi:hypothetical protein
MNDSTSRGHDWNEAERGQICRLQDFCENMAHWTVESSRADGGDPWCVIYDHWRRCVILRIARIDLQYVTTWPPEQRGAKRTSMAVAVTTALARLGAYEQRGR